MRETESDSSNSLQHKQDEIKHPGLHVWCCVSRQAEAEKIELNIISNNHVFKGNHIKVVKRCSSKCQNRVSFTRSLIDAKRRAEGARADSQLAQGYFRRRRTREEEESCANQGAGEGLGEVLSANGSAATKTRPTWAKNLVLINEHAFNPL